MITGDEFKIVREIPFAELEKRLRSICLLNQPNVHPYEKAKITIERFTWEDIAPMSRYVLSRQLATQRAIRDAIMPGGYDPLELQLGLVVTGGPKGEKGLIPPIIESFEAKGITQPCLLDGIHRLYLGRTQGRKDFLCVYAQGIRLDCPPYAFPNKWDEVQECVELPAARAAWKNYRGDVNKGEQYALYRDFSTINGSTPRVDNR